MSNFSTTFKSKLKSFGDEIQQEVEKDGIGGTTLATIFEGQIIFEQSCGWANQKKNIKTDLNTVYRIASITKPFTALLLMKLYEYNVLKIDDAVEAFFPEIQNLTGYSILETPITFRQLASHSAGLPTEPELSTAAEGPNENWKEKVLAAIPTTSIQNTPGTQFQYSNIGYGILGLAMARAAQKDFIRLIEDYIFSPLSMANSCSVLSQNQSNWAIGYDKKPDGSCDTDSPKKEHAGRGYKMPSGGLCSTTEDLARFVAEQTGHSNTSILSPEHRIEMQRIQMPVLGNTRYNGYGLGYQITSHNGNHIIGHGGDFIGYISGVYFDPATSLGIIILRNFSEPETLIRRRTIALLRELISLL